MRRGPNKRLFTFDQSGGKLMGMCEATPVLIRTDFHTDFHIS